MIILSLAASLAWTGGALASPGDGPHETLDFGLSTMDPGTPSGYGFSGTYHAAGNRQADPPYLRRMEYFMPPGTRYDTSVPARCSASDLQLQTFGPAACPPASQIASGTVTGSIHGGPAGGTLSATVFNNVGEQIILTAYPMTYVVARGKFGPGGTIDFTMPTCFPAGQPPESCPSDEMLQLGSSIKGAPYTIAAGGTVRSYLTTPPACPATRRWQVPVRLWFSDGSVDNVLTQQPCAAAGAAAAPSGGSKQLVGSKTVRRGTACRRMHKMRRLHPRRRPRLRQLFLGGRGRCRSQARHPVRR